MASSLLALIDDIATLLDDVALLSKVAAKKTAGVLGDDLALNAEQVTGISAERELPVVWEVAKGSLVNKLILVPTALALSALAPWSITPLLMAGGLYLCYEGCEKLAHSLLQSKSSEAEEQRELLHQLADALLPRRHELLHHWVVFQHGGGCCVHHRAVSMWLSWSKNWLTSDSSW